MKPKVDQPEWIDWPLGFRPLLRMVVAADCWVGVGSPDRPSAEANWPAAFLTVAEACATGHPVGVGTWSLALNNVVVATDQEREWVVLMMATPMVLINANPQGHRRSVIQAWGQQVGLGASTLVTLDRYFQLVGQRGRAGRWASDDWPWATPRGMAAPLTMDANFNEVVRLVASLQGQALPALTLAHRQGWPSVALALVGVLSSLRLGSGGLPLARLADQANRGDLGPRWQNYDFAQMDCLADALYQRWCGVASGLPGERL